MLNTTPYRKRKGVTPDISAYLQFTFWERVLYLDHEQSFPDPKERSGYWVGVADNIGDALTYWILDDQSGQLLARSVVRPYNKNVRVKWDPTFAQTPIKWTAQKGGDETLLPIQERTGLLDTSTDEYDEHERAPRPHPPIVTQLIPDNPRTVTKSEPISFPRTIDEGPPEELLFPRPDADPYEGDSLLKWSHRPLPQHPEIETRTQKKKKKYKDVAYPTAFTPPEVDDIVDLTTEEEQEDTQAHQQEPLPEPLQESLSQFSHHQRDP